MKPLWNGTGCYVPREVATCPECDGELTARSMEWESETGQPVATGIQVDCMNDIRTVQDEQFHAWRQSDWQPIRDRIVKWCGARLDFGR